MPNRKVSELQATIMTRGRDSSLEALVCVLELTASERPELLDLHLDALLHSNMRPTVLRLAAEFGVSVDKLEHSLYRASLDLDRLEKARRVWRDPARVLEAPNLAALVGLCRARAGRVHAIARRRRLETILGKLERAYELARSRAWIEDFIGPPQNQRQEAQGADR